jgi:hypothetical protein
MLAKVYLADGKATRIWVPEYEEKINWSKRLDELGRNELRPYKGIRKSAAELD